MKKWFRKIKNWYIKRQIVKKENAPKTEIEPNWYKIAKGEHGTKEIYGNKHNKRILEYHATTQGYGSDEVAWCSSFVNWCMNKAGLPGTGSAAARSWMNWGKSVKDPIIGDIVVFYRGKKSGWKGHVGFYAGKKGSKILVLGGNQNNSVCFQYYGKSKVLGYRRGL